MLELPEIFVVMRPLTPDEERTYWELLSEKSVAGHAEWILQSKRGDMELMEVHGFGVKYDGRYRNGNKVKWTKEEKHLCEFTEPTYEERFFDLGNGRFLYFATDYNNPPDFHICKKKGVHLKDETKVFFIEWMPTNAVEWNGKGMAPSTHRIIDNGHKFQTKEEAENYIAKEWPGWAPNNQVINDVYIGIIELSQ